MKKITKAVIPVAGLGTRFLPATKTMPKELLPIVDKPVLQYVVEECVASGIEDIYLVISPNKESINEYFSPNPLLENQLQEKGKLELLKLIKDIPRLCRFHYIVQDKQLGTGHAINLAKDYIKDEPFAVLFGDGLRKYDVPVLQQLIDIYEAYDCNVIGVKEVDIKDVNRYGIIDYENKQSGRIKTIVEKPKTAEAPSRMAASGDYIVKPEVFAELATIDRGINGEYQLTDAMANLMKYQPFYACQFKGEYFDTGNPLGYIIANIAFGLEHESIKEDLREYLTNLKDL